MSKFKKRVDNNQLKVVGELRNLGFCVYLTHKLGSGFPDFIIGFCGINYLVELKTGNGKLTKSEFDFFNNWQGQVNLHYDTSDILDGLLQYMCLIDGFNITSKQILLTEKIKLYETKTC